MIRTAPNVPPIDLMMRNKKFHREVYLTILQMRTPCSSKVITYLNNLALFI